MSLLRMNRIQPDERNTRRSLLLGILIWFLHLNIAYGLASLSCHWGWLSTEVAGLTGLRIVETIITIIVLLLMLLVIYLPWMQWREFQPGKPTENPQLLQQTEEDRRPFMAFVAMMSNSILLLFVIATIVPIYAFRPCVQG